MKQITAYVKPLKLAETTLALHKIEGLTGMTVIDCKGYGRGVAKSLVEGLVDYLPHVKIEIACTDEIVEEIVSTIQKSAHTGLHGDGKIFVMTIESAVRISTGERGQVAV